MEALFRRGRATVNEVLEDLVEPPTYSAVRAMLGTLEQKGYARHEREGLRYVYSTTMNAEKARRSALRRLVDTYFGGSPERVVAAVLGLPEDTGDMSVEELRQAIERSRKRGR